MAYLVRFADGRRAVATRAKVLGWEHDAYIRRLRRHYPVFKNPDVCEASEGGVCETKGKIAIFMMGISGAGKTTWVKEHFDQSEWVIVDPDAFLSLYPGYDPNDPYPAHEATVHLAEEAYQNALSHGHKIVLDTSGTKAEKLIRRIKEAKQRGYCTHMVYVCVSVACALQRNRLRPRHVREDIILEKAKEVDVTFGEAAKHADAVTVFDNNKHCEELVGLGNPWMPRTNPIHRYAKTEEDAQRVKGELEKQGFQVLSIQKVKEGEWEVNFTTAKNPSSPRPLDRAIALVREAMVREAEEEEADDVALAREILEQLQLLKDEIRLGSHVSAHEAAQRAIVLLDRFIAKEKGEGEPYDAKRLEQAKAHVAKVKV